MSITANISKQLEQSYSYIRSCQLSNGAILWFKNGKLDPWDHCEALMALSIAKDFEASLRAFDWLQDNQNSNGTWYAAYVFETEQTNKLGTNAPVQASTKPPAQTNKPTEKDLNKIETNFVAYPATALWHYWLCSNDKNHVEKYWPTIERAINYVCLQQNQEGDIQWACSELEALPNDALITACSSILRSLECAIKLSHLVDQQNKHWQQAYQKLKTCLRNKPWRFDRSWPSKDRFSMDWFYPVLSGALNQEEAQLRLKKDWKKFVEPGLGCRCVSDEPWMTVAESCELVIALVAAGRTQEAEAMFGDLLKWQDTDGGFWTGYQYANQNIWPLEKPSWTAAAIILAADALWQLSPAHTLFTQTEAKTSPVKES
ncbi:prenyltransferase [Agaribacterium sp. ZY112]|uniref:prenyltransferase n=1 Tax=Agaribacterium sp. ZY112 TaxID=3233574 RepID=UPI0035250B08